MCGDLNVLHIGSYTLDGAQMQMKRLSLSAIRRATIESCKAFVLICIVSPGVDASIVKYGTEKEVMVTV